MAINLLPSEEKAKAKTEKQSREQTIVMTGPTHSEKSRSSVKRAGVLTFFKGAFSRPKKQVADETAVRLPERKVNIEEHIVYRAAPALPEKKVITYVKPAAKPVVTPHPLPKDSGGFLARFMRRQSAPVAPAVPTQPLGERFPKYSPVRSEREVSQPVDDQHRHGDVITVTTVAGLSKSTHQGSFFTRLLHWLRGLFARAEKPAVVKPAATEIEAMPTPVEPALSVRFKAAAVSSPIIAPTPKVIQPVRPTVIAPTTPSPAPAIKFSKPVVSSVPIPSVAKPAVPAMPVVPPAPTIPIVQAVPKKKHATNEAMRMTEAQPMTQAEPKKQQLSGWMRLLQWFKELFHRPAAASHTLQAQAGLGAGAPLGTNWEVNLVPEESLEQEISISRVMMLATFIVVAVGVVFGGWLWANWYYNSITTEINKMNNQIVIADIQIRSYEKMLNEINELRVQIDNVSTLLDKHVYWSSFFSELERATSPDVYFTSMSADVNGTVTLQAVGRNYDAAIKQLMVFEKAQSFVSDVTVSGIAFTGTLAESTNTTATSAIGSATPAARVGDTPVTFTVELTVQPAIFYFSPTL
ncbi:MAG: hypothetical protein HZC01_01205 [Candidatus Kerfeldbacteria bacterium]|nr:hypothetical protein [Candidatus Kerfeldbacteria bacterium]